MFLLEGKLFVWRSDIMIIRGRCFCDVGCVDTWDAGSVVCCQLVFVSSSTLNSGCSETM
jgi:hypothetical protein